MKSASTQGQVCHSGNSQSNQSFRTTTLEEGVQDLSLSKKERRM